MSQTKVVCTGDGAYDIYIGRIRGSNTHYGNPFIIGRDGSRETVITKCRNWLAGVAYAHIQPKRRKWILENLYALKGKRLGCPGNCKPGDCHGDIYVELLKKEEDNEKDLRESEAGGRSKET